MSEPDERTFDDWRRAPNIAGDPDTYELENLALHRDGRLDRALWRIAPWDGRRLVDVGCGTGFWLPLYAACACRVQGVEPDPRLFELAARRVADHDGVDAIAGSAEHLPLDDHSVDVAHARFAYFFGPGAEAGLAEVARVLAPGGVLVVIDNSWRGGELAELLRASSSGNAALDPAATDHWWAERGAVRHEVAGGWTATSASELERILRLEFPGDVVDRFVTDRARPDIGYHFAVFEWRP